MKFLLDDNIPYSVKKWFQQKKLEAIKLFEVGLKGARDEEILLITVSNEPIDYAEEVTFFDAI